MHIVLLCLEAILMGAPYAVPAIPPLLGAAMFWAGAIGLAVTILWAGVSRTPLKNKILLWRSVSNDPVIKEGTTPDELISLSDAARLMYELASEKLKQDIRSWTKSGEEIEHQCKMCILVAAGQGVVDLLGRRAEGLVREIISADEVENMYPNDGDAIGFLAHANSYIDVAMKRSDINKVVQNFED
jgi:hypothetical protein